MGFFDFLTASGRVRAWQQEANNVVAFLRTMGPMEIIESRATAAAALAFILLNAGTDGDSNVLVTGLEAVHEPTRRLTREEEGHLSLFNAKLIGLQKQAYASAAPINQFIAAGIPIWLVSFRAAMKPELVALGRDMWAELDRPAIKDVEERIEDVAAHLTGHPMHDQLMMWNIKRLETPELFIRR